MWVVVAHLMGVVHWGANGGGGGAVAVVKDSSASDGSVALQ